MMVSYKNHFYPNQTIPFGKPSPWCTLGGSGVILEELTPVRILKSGVSLPPKLLPKMGRGSSVVKLMDC